MTNLAQSWLNLLGYGLNTWQGSQKVKNGRSLTGLYFITSCESCLPLHIFRSTRHLTFVFCSCISFHVVSAIVTIRGGSIRNSELKFRLKMILQMTETSPKKLQLPQVMLGFLRNFHLTAWQCKQKLGCFLLPGTGTSPSKLPLRGWYVNFKLQQK